MAAARVQVVMTPEEREAFRAEAHREGTSLSAFLRLAAREKVASTAGRRRWTAKELGRFFRDRGKAEKGVEPEWEEHLRVAAASRAEGRGES
jgi:hypothetical protein